MIAKQQSKAGRDLLGVDVQAELLCGVYSLRSPRFVISMAQDSAGVVSGRKPWWVSFAQSFERMTRLNGRPATTEGVDFAFARCDAVSGAQRLRGVFWHH